MKGSVSSLSGAGKERTRRASHSTNQEYSGSTFKLYEKLYIGGERWEDLRDFKDPAPTVLFRSAGKPIAIQPAPYSTPNRPSNPTPIRTRK